eukprot:COSAG01_NODE_2169_length_8243_cov_3.244720_1_plen_91_part_00
MARRLRSATLGISRLSGAHGPNGLLSRSGSRHSESSRRVEANITPQAPRARKALPRSLRHYSAAIICTCAGQCAGVVARLPYCKQHNFGG